MKKYNYDKFINGLEENFDGVYVDKQIIYDPDTNGEADSYFDVNLFNDEVLIMDSYEEYLRFKGEEAKVRIEDLKKENPKKYSAGLKEFTENYSEYLLDNAASQEDAYLFTIRSSEEQKEQIKRDYENFLLTNEMTIDRNQLYLSSELIKRSDLEKVYILVHRVALPHVFCATYSLDLAKSIKEYLGDESIEIYKYNGEFIFEKSLETPKLKKDGTNSRNPYEEDGGLEL